MIKKIFNETGSIKSKEIGFINYFSDDFINLYQKKDVTELMINSCESIYYEQNGYVYMADFIVQDIQIQRFIDYVSGLNSRNIDYQHPIFDGKLPDGSRCNIVIPPASLKGVIITIRKHSELINDLKVLVNKSMI